MTDVDKDKQMYRQSIFVDWGNTVKMLILPKAICRSNANPLKTSVAFFHRNRKTHLQV